MALMTKIRDRRGRSGPASEQAPPYARGRRQESTLDESTSSTGDSESLIAEAVLSEGADNTANGAVDDEQAAPKQNWWQRRQEMKKLEGKFEHYPHLLALKPKERHVFRSDYFEVDSSVGCVLSFFHDSAAQDGFAAFWGIGRIPDGLDDRVTAVVLEQIVRRDQKWIDQYTKQSEKLDKLESGEQAESGTTSSRRKAKKVAGDMETVIGELQDGAAYLSVQNRLLLKAPDLVTLEETIERISRLYIDRFGTIKAAPYAGEQRQELSGLFKKNDKKRGPGFHFTSTELAGSYSLVTNGLNDYSGEYVGFMIGDVNNSAVLMDTNGYSHHVVVADNAVSDYLGRERVANMWGSKLSQSCLLANGSVVHLVLDGANLDKLGPRFDGLTARVDLNSGDVNMFEMFGDEDDELSIFSSQMKKLTLMFEQLYEARDAGMNSIIRDNLETIAEQFYVDQRMWVRNAKENRSRLRLVGIPHDQVPRLQMFMSYLDTALKERENSSKNNQSTLDALTVLTGVARNLLNTNGDLFNNFTAEAVDGVRDAKRVVYDFSRLMRRGKGVAMAQLVNIVGFAIGKLQHGDTVIIHGAEHIDERVKEYIQGQFEHLFHRGGRVVFSYNDTDKMLEDAEFNKFDAADFTIFGTMRDKTVEDYQKLLHQEIPKDLAKLITRKGENLSYLRRGHSNVVFHLDLALGINPNREKQRREMQRKARQLEESKRLAAVMTEKPVPGANTTGGGGSNEDRKQAEAQRGALPVRMRKASGKKTLATAGKASIATRSREATKEGPQMTMTTRRDDGSAR